MLKQGSQKLSTVGAGKALGEHVVCGYSLVRCCSNYELPPLQFDLTMTGFTSPENRKQFWRHCRGCKEWQDHPVFEGPPETERLIPLMLHHDGAEMFKMAEYYVTSLSSPFASLAISDIYDKKLVCCIVAHELVPTKQAA